MQNYQKIMKLISDFIENGILSSDDLKKEIITNLKFKKEKIINDLQLVRKEDFIQLKRLVEKQEKIIKNLKKKQNQEGSDTLNNKPPSWLFDNCMFPPCEFTISSTIARPKPTPFLFILLLLSNL